MKICVSPVDAVLQPRTLDTRLGILTKILVAMGYFFFFFKYISGKYLQFKTKAKIFVKKYFWFAPYK